MSLCKSQICAISLLVTLAVTLNASRFVTLVEAASARPNVSSSNHTKQQQQHTRPPEAIIEERDRAQNGITVSEPKIYDDALLQQMLRAAEARLAALQVIDQTAITSRLGAVTGASQRISAFGLNVQGAPVPGVVTTTKLPTQTTTEGLQTTDTTTVSATPSSTSGTTTSLQTVSNLAVNDVVTTQSPFSAPAAVAPAPTTQLPSSFSVSASDILNEQMQLSAEINGLRLLLAGSLSDYFMRHRPDQKPGEQDLPKFRTTLGFQVALATTENYKDAVAIVEVEISNHEIIEQAVRNEVSRNLANAKVKDKLCPSTEPDREKCTRERIETHIANSEPPAVTAIIPREKTYNVASITDRSTSIGGGVATQILGFSGSWISGHKTYYLVQDQDTVALTYAPTNRNLAGFRWQFRPVLGQRYVKSGLKQTFVQLAFPTTIDARDGEIGKVTVRTYWRKYDRKTGVLKKVVPNSYREMYSNLDLPSFRQPVRPTFDATQVEDLGDGYALVKLEGRFLPGTYVRIGGTVLTESAGLKFEHYGIKFTAPIATLATRNVFVTAHDGREDPLAFPCSTGFQIGKPSVTPVDEATSKLTVPVTPPASVAPGALPKMLLVIGQRVFGYSDGPLLPHDPKLPGTLSANIPNALLTPTATVVVRPLLASDDCISKPEPIGHLKPSGPERLTLLERGKEKITFLLTGTGLSTVRVISPAGVTLANVVPSQADTMRLLTLNADHLLTHKHILVQRGTAKPFLIAIPPLDPPAPPKALGTIGLMRDDVFIVGDGMSNIESITFRDQPFTSFKVLNDQTLLLTGLSALNASSSAGPLRFFLKFKSESRPKVVDVQVVTSRDDSVKSSPD